MNPLDSSLSTTLSRRSFLGSDRPRPRRHGRPRSLLRRGLPNAARRRLRPTRSALRAQGQAGHLSVPVRRPVADRSVRLQAARWNKLHGEELPDSIRQGQRLTGMTSGQTSVSRRASPSFAFKQLRPQPARGSATCCRTPQKIADDICRHPLDAHRGDQPRSRHHLHQHRLAAARPPQHGRVGQLRPRQR